MTRRSWHQIGLAIALLCASVALRPARAQSKSADGVIDGVVSDTNLVSLSDATASILGSQVHVTTGANGRFRIHGLHPGDYILVIHRLGYKPMSASVELVGSDTLRMAFPLQAIATALDTVSVIGERMSARMSEFEVRRTAGIGHFITAEQIAARNQVYLGDVLRDELSVAIVSDGHGGERAVNLRMTLALNTAPCLFSIYVDGVPLRGAPSMNDLPAPSQIAGIEIYAGGATTPIQYRGSACGLILVWTKDGA